MLDILIKNGEIVDGSGKSRYRADVAVRGDRICEIGPLEGAEARTTLDATGRVVTPGFVDMHSHADYSLPVCPTADSLIHQGVTSAVVGQCGYSPAPLRPEHREQSVFILPSSDLAPFWEHWTTFEDYLAHLAQIAPAINVAPLVGLGAVRTAVMGFGAEAANEEQIAHMQELVRAALDAGAVGVSSGLLYPPGSFASTKELIAVSRPAGQQGKPYFSHIRDEGINLLQAVSEAIRVGRESGAAVQISHFKAFGQANWRNMAPALALVDQARGAGLDVSADVYPYTAGCTTLAAMLPQWAQEGGKTATLELLADVEARKKIAASMQSEGLLLETPWDKVMISHAPSQPGYAGQYVDALAEQAGKSPFDWTFDALLEAELDVTMICFGIAEDNLKLTLQHPATMIGSDGMGLTLQGPLAAGMPHPRNYGTFPRVLGHYARQQGVLSLEAAVHKMSGLPANKLRWTDRGLVKKGLKADLVVLDPGTVSDRATYTAPQQYPVGIQHVLVNGKLALHDGELTQARPGNILSH